jgi:hypothetical protein
MEIGVVDEVVAPADTRKRIAEALAAAPPARQHVALELSQVLWQPRREALVRIVRHHRHATHRAVLAVHPFGREASRSRRRL